MGGLVYVLGSCGSLQQTLLWGWEFLPQPQPPQYFTARGLRFYFPALEPWVEGSVSLPCCSSQFFHTQMWDHQLPPHPPGPLPCCTSCPPQLPISTPPTRLDECFFFNSLVVRLPYSSVFWQFWFFVFKFVVLLLVVQRSKVYLSLCQKFQLSFDLSLYLKYLSDIPKVGSLLT